MTPEERLRELWERIPSGFCKGLCHDTCCFTDGSNTERLMVRRAGVKLPQAHEMSDRARRQDMYRCPALVDNRCSVYEDRPTICRTWGASESQPCEYGCAPEGVLSLEETYEIIAEAYRIGGGGAETVMKLERFLVLLAQHPEERDTVLAAAREVAVRRNVIGLQLDE